MSDHSNNTESEAKRRKIRKGTRSCWDCKRRKMKCMFDSPTDAICIGCQRRGTKCVSQEFPDEISAPLAGDRQMGLRVVRVEALVEQLMKKVGNDKALATDRRATSEDSGIPISNIFTPASMKSEPSRSQSLYTPSEDKGAVENEIIHRCSGFDKLQSAPDESAARSGECERLLRDLRGSLPSQQDVDTICEVDGRMTMMYCKHMTMPDRALDDGQSVKSFLEIPGPNAHPVLTARYMLYVAFFLQYLPHRFREGSNGLSEERGALMKRLVDTASGLVTTNNALLGSIEALECIMLESVYECNAGNLRRSWITIRRALGIAQMMGIHRFGDKPQYNVLDANSRADPQLMWLKIVYYDRHLSLLLNLPQGTLDRSMGSEAMLANKTHLGRLEQMHSVIASRILERNEANPGPYNFSLTQDLDVALQRVARIMPSNWWLSPNWTQAIDDPHALFSDSQRLARQLFHYNLLNKLHIPYMLRSSEERKYEYSRMTCVTASREVLSRFVTFRSLDHNECCCRIIDFFAIMAAMTLLLAHLDGHRSWQAGNFLAHQRHSDRAMVEQALKNMEQISRKNADALSTQSADLLRRLLAVEAEAADGFMQNAESVSVVQSLGSEMPQREQDNNNVICVHIPYFGIIKIAREGVLSKEIPKSKSLGAKSSQDQPNSEPDPPRRHFANHSERQNAGVVRPTEMDYSRVNEVSTPAVLRSASRDTYMDTQATFTGDSGVVADFAPPLPSTTSELLLPQHDYPLLTAGVDDWAFQGVDMAFFDNLVRGYDDDGSSES